PPRGDACHNADDGTDEEHAPLSLHDALPIYGAGLDTASSGENEWRSAGLQPGDSGYGSSKGAVPEAGVPAVVSRCAQQAIQRRQDRKSTRVNSRHRTSSYAVFCLKTKPHNPP